MLNLGFRATSSLSVALLAVTVSGCVFVGDFDDDFVPISSSLMYEVCYSDIECVGGRYCEDIAFPASRYTDYVNAICTVGCFDDLDCRISEFNGFPGACTDHAFLGGPLTSRICVERCELDIDCDVANGFGCELVAGERICVPVY